MYGVFQFYTNYTGSKIHNGNPMTRRNKLLPTAIPKPHTHHYRCIGQGKVEVRDPGGEAKGVERKTLGGGRGAENTRYTVHLFFFLFFFF